MEHICNIKRNLLPCDYEFTINYKQLKPIPNKTTRVPYKILSVDIEASSSHGDFPLAKKNYLEFGNKYNRLFNKI